LAGFGFFAAAGFFRFRTAACTFRLGNFKPFVSVAFEALGDILDIDFIADEVLAAIECIEFGQVGYFVGKFV